MANLERLNVLTTRDWLPQLTVGSEVAYGSSNSGKGQPVFEFSKVKSISPTRSVITLESGHKFNQNGEERGEASSWGRKWLLAPAEANYRIAQQKAVKG